MSLFDSSKGCLQPLWIDQVGFLPCGHCLVCKKNLKKLNEGVHSWLSKIKK